MALRQPLALNNASTTERPPADVFRLMMAALMGGSTGAAVAGVVGATSMAVTEHAGTPNNTVDIAAGGAFAEATEGSSYGVYFAYNDAAVSVTVTTGNATNPRKDLVIMEVEDSAEAGTPDDAHFVVVAGTAAASPVDPDLQALGYDNYVTLARIDVPALDTVITNSQITDLRVQSGPKWTTYTPTLSADGGSPTLGNGTVLGRYIRSGRLCTVEFALTLGTTTNFGTGNLYVALPFTMATPSPTRTTIGSFEAFRPSDTSSQQGAVIPITPWTKVALVPHNSVAAVQGASVPWAWATGYGLTFNATYETAS